MDLVRDYFDHESIAQYQLDSYDYLVTKGLQEVVLADPYLECSNGDKMYFNEIEVTPCYKPNHEDAMQPLYPQECRDQMVTYEGQLLLNIMIHPHKGKPVALVRMPIGKLPIMVRSNLCFLNKNNALEHRECEMDPGGYFIINGKERVLVSQLRPAYDRPYVIPVGPSELVAEIRTVNPNGLTLMIKVKLCNDQLSISLPHIKGFILAGYVFRAYGVPWEDLETNLKLPQPYIDLLKEQYHQLNSSDEAKQEILSVMSEQKLSNLDYILQQEIFFNVHDRSPLNLCLHFGYMMKKLVETHTKVRTLDDKESLKNKRLDAVDSLILFLFRPLYKQFHKSIQTVIASRKSSTLDYQNLIKSSVNFTNKITSCFTTGIWEINKSFNFCRTGVSQILSVQNYGAKISHLRRCMLPIGNKGKKSKMRGVHQSDIGFKCPFETPEGQQVGIVNNLSLLVKLGHKTPFQEMMLVIKLMQNYLSDHSGKYMVLLNNEIIGSTHDLYAFHKEFYELRETNLVESTTSLVKLKDEKEVHIQCDGGRLVRPFFKVKQRVVGDNLKRELLCPQYVSQEGSSWPLNVKLNNVIYRDAWEIEESTIAMTKDKLTQYKCDLMELDPAALFGIMASVIPFTNNSQSPRISYQASMHKQDIGIHSLNFTHRHDTTAELLQTPQKPLITTEFTHLLNFDTMSHGTNFIVAFLTGRYNQEDSFMINKGSLDRGLATSITYKTIVVTKKIESSDVTICIPKASLRKKLCNYEYLNFEGVIQKPTSGSLWINKDTVLVGQIMNKTIKANNKREDMTIDISVATKENEQGWLDQVTDCMNHDGIRVIKVRIRIPRIPVVGDKFASCCAQKGTVGLIVPPEDLPFDKHGMQPDLLINPHCIPSRMTINNLLEVFFNKLYVTKGIKYDATPYKNKDIQGDLKRFLDEFADQDEDLINTTMYCGMTGRRLNTKVFMGPAFFQRLKHMVDCKIHVRSTGPYEPLTRQPVSGRSMGGGLRIGEMERDALISHGASKYLNEVLFKNSDDYSVNVCTTCGTIPLNLRTCHVCREKAVIEEKNMPYACKVLFQFLMGMGIKVRIH